MFDPKSRILGYRPEQIIVLDTETTGVMNEDEIIQLSGIDGYGREVLNLFLKPENKTSWPMAEAVHHISPAMVQNCPTLRELRAQLQNFLDKYSCIVGYNIAFDIRMLTRSELRTSHMSILDVMPIYVRNYGVMKGNRRAAKLVEAAEHYGYDFGAHDSLEDVKATLVVLENLIREGKC